VGKKNFKNEIKFVKKLLGDFIVSKNYTRVAVVTFSSVAKVVSKIDKLTTDGIILQKP
jgi:sushi, von Willebrand factor type A, EGF and pentraxin domain-containing protein 1